MLGIIARAREITKSDLQERIALDFAIVGRQIDYYYNVLKWMNLCEDKDLRIRLTPRGMEIAFLPYSKIMKRCAEIIFSEEVFYIALHQGVEAIPNNLFVEKWGVSGSTIPRRKQAMKQWIEYFRMVFE